MAKQESKHSTIFFHMGPGFHSKLEAHQFSAKYPHVLFLDQPLHTNFTDLVDWSAQTIRTQAENAQKPLRLLGHSFGGQLIARALPQVADNVSEIRLLNSTCDSFDCFANLQSILLPTEAQGREYWRKQSAADKMGLIFQLVGVAGFGDAYWFNRKSQSDYEKIAATYPALDVGSFVKTFTDYLQIPAQPAPTNWHGPAKIYYSVTDNLIKNIDVVADWKKILPKAQLIEVPKTGHHAYFESSEFAQEFFKD